VNGRDPLAGLAAAWGKRLRNIDYNSLPLSDYNKRYLAAVKPALDYYMHIYAHCLHQGLRALGMEAAGITLVDYGGGSGFLGLLAKAAGFGRVLYVDINPLSTETAAVLKRQTGTGPDVLLTGDADTLAAYCRAEGIRPQLLIAADVIEHVYDPAAFFARLIAVNPRMQLIFTTASTPFNPLVKGRLRRFMKG
jgi:2-polyprenyl-3-methyl-5-hydroxy-6-metoxy-1,4-benzoquinol methylase